MKNKQFKKNLSPQLVTALGAAALVGSAHAQDLTGSYGSFSEAALRSAALESFGGDFFGDDEQLDEGGFWDYFKFGVNVRVEYNDNIFLTNSGEVDDVIFRVSVPLEFSNERTAENQWHIKYTPTYNFYTDNSSQDGMDHLVRLGYKHQFAKTAVDVGAGYAKTEGPNRFASGSIEKESLTGRLGVNHILSGKSRLDLDLGLVNDDFVDENLFDRTRYNARLAWQYQMTGKTTLGPYIGYEHIDIDSNPNHDAISGGLKLSYQALAKTVVTGYAGIEHRSFDGGDVSDKTSPTFEFGATHQYSGKTSFTGMLYHNVRASYSDSGYSYTATGLNLLANYAYSSRINFRTGITYEYDDYYEVAASAANADLDSHYFTYYLGGDYVMDNGFTVGSGVRFSTSNSDSEFREFDNFIFNINGSYQF